VGDPAVDVVLGVNLSLADLMKLVKVDARRVTRLDALELDVVGPHVDGALQPLALFTCHPIPLTDL
jgi:hypothetical protein